MGPGPQEIKTYIDLGTVVCLQGCLGCLGCLACLARARRTRTHAMWNPRLAAPPQNTDMTHRHDSDMTDMTQCMNELPNELITE
eukprot:15480575-Alexandrium_andersonii.AAC.1